MLAELLELIWDSSQAEGDQSLRQATPTVVQKRNASKTRRTLSCVIVLVPSDCIFSGSLPWEILRSSAKGEFTTISCVATAEGHVASRFLTYPNTSAKIVQAVRTTPGTSRTGPALRPTRLLPLAPLLCTRADYTIAGSRMDVITFMAEQGDVARASSDVHAVEPGSSPRAPGPLPNVRQDPGL